MKDLPPWLVLSVCFVAGCSAPILPQQPASTPPPTAVATPSPILPSSLPVTQPPVIATPTPQALVSPQQIEQEARDLAARTMPELLVITAQIDSVSVELLRRTTPVYRVEVRGFFCMGGMGPGLYQTDMRIFTFDARTGQWMGSTTGQSMPVSDCSSCAARSPADLVARADVIFRGRVLAGSQPPDEQGIFYPSQRFTFAVDTQWKGSLASTVEVLVNWTGVTAARVDMRLDQDYLVLAEQSRDGLRTDACLGTAPVGSALPELVRVLGPGTPTGGQ